MLQTATQSFRFYTDLHNKKINDRRQALITKFIRPVMPDEPAEEEPVPGTSAEEAMPEAPSLPSVEELFTEEEMINLKDLC